MKKIGRLKTYTSKEIENAFVGIGFETLDREMFRPEMCYEPLSRTGVKYARCQTGWKRTETKKGIYDFKWLDDVVDNLIAVGVEPWFNVGYGNPLYMDDIPNEYAIGCVPFYYTEETLEAWKNYVGAMAEHFAGRVRDFEIWNEPDLDGHWFWYPRERSAPDYAQLVKLTGDIIRRSVPNARIGANIAHIENLEYTKEMADHLNPSDIDFVTYHYYSRTPESPFFEMNIGPFKKIFTDRGFKVEFWQGEGGFPSWVYAGHYLAHEGTNSERGQAIWHLRRFFNDFSYGATRYSFFQMADMWEKTYKTAASTIEKPAAYGILNGKTYTKKKSYETISYMAALLCGNTEPADIPFSGYIKDPEGSKAIWAYQQTSAKYLSFKKNGKPFFVYYTPGSITNEEAEEQEFAAYVYADIDDPVLIDTYTGEVFDISENPKEYRSAWKATVYRDLVIRDYPMIICDKSIFEIIE